MKTNKFLTLDKINDEISLKDCIVKKNDSLEIQEGKNEGDGYFRITSICKEDLKAKGFDVLNITEQQMSMLAFKMADEYYEKYFWKSIEQNAMDMGFTKLENEKDSD